MTHAMETANHRAFEGRLALKAYRNASGLMPAEEAILARLRPRIEGKRILDMGVGGGRTTPALLQLSPHYTALDYSAKLVEQVKAKFGLESAYCCDAREMGCFADATFDFILFSFNGLDYVTHEGRLQALNEIRRILSPQGVFVFSSHNRALLEQRGTAAGSSSSYSAVTSLKRAVNRILLLGRHWRARRHEVTTDEYAIVNDSGLHYSLLSYYISVRSQIDQLKKVGFVVEGAFDSKGHPAPDDDPSPWIHYVASK